MLESTGDPPSPLSCSAGWINGGSPWTVAFDDGVTMFAKVGAYGKRELGAPFVCASTPFIAALRPFAPFVCGHEGSSGLFFR